MPLYLTVGQQNLTREADGITFSTVDPGGLEACSFSIQARNEGVAVGQRVRITSGPQIVWEGRVAEVQRTLAAGKEQTTVSATGYGAALKDTTYSMIYVDRDFSHWTEASVQRKIDLVAANYGLAGFSVTPDETTGNPSLIQSIQGAWTATSMPMSEAWYDAGSGCHIALLYGAWTRGTNINNADTNWFWDVALTDDDRRAISPYDGGGTLRAAGPSTVELPSTGDRRFASVQLAYTTGPAGSDNTNYDLYWSALAVYGDHDLTLRGSAPYGLYPSDIARHALLQTDGIVPGIIEDSTEFILPQAEYRSPTTPEQVITDMGKFLGWHWGVWEGLTMFDDRPRFDFRAPPTTATCFISRAQCDQLDIAERLDGLYNQAKIKFQTTAGTASFVTVERALDLLNDAGLSRDLVADIGTSTEEAAETYGSFLLALSERQERAAGSVTLSGDVGIPGGGTKPAYMLRAGLDRLRITDLTNRRSWTDTDGRDTFRIKRTETTVDSNGRAVTKVEFDAGADLIEVMQARFDLATTLAL